MLPHQRGAQRQVKAPNNTEVAAARGKNTPDVSAIRPQRKSTTRQRSSLSREAPSAHLRLDQARHLSLQRCELLRSIRWLCGRCNGFVHARGAPTTPQRAAWADSKRVASRMARAAGAESLLLCAPRLRKRGAAWSSTGQRGRVARRCAARAGWR